MIWKSTGKIIKNCKEHKYLETISQKGNSEREVFCENRFSTSKLQDIKIAAYTKRKNKKKNAHKKTVIQETQYKMCNLHYDVIQSIF